MKLEIEGSRNTRVYSATAVSLLVMIIVVAGIFHLLFSFPPPLTVKDMFQAPIVIIPFNAGWIGLALVLANGFFLSLLLCGNGLDNAERLLLSVGLGFGLNFVIMILIGILGGFSPVMIILTQTILLVSLITAKVRKASKASFNFLSSMLRSYHRQRPSFLIAAPLALISLFSAAAIYKAVSLPATEWDSLAYGVNYAKIIFDKGSIPLIAGPSIGLEMSASYPPGIQLTAVYLYMFAGNANDFYFRILSPIFGLATLITTSKFAMIVSKNRIASVFAVFALGSIPFFWELFIQETYLMGLGLMLTLAALFFYKAYHLDPARSRNYEIIGSLFCCFSALVSYIGVFSFGLLLLYAINAKISLKRFATLIGFALIVTMPWYGRNLVLLGNPLYPFFDIGKYLDPLLRNSTVQHFQNYAMIPMYNWTLSICKLAGSLLLIAIAYLTIAKRKNFLVVSTFYLLLVGATMMALHLPFPRYLIVAFPCSAVMVSVTLMWLFKMKSVARIIVIPIVAVFFISSVVVLPYMNLSKPAAMLGDDKWSYLSRVFEEADAWKWVNENTPVDARIATFDIKEYYIDRDIVPLDGNESAPIYEMDTIEESIVFLQNRGITHVLSVPWASPTDPRLPPAYKLCILTRYLGDPRFLPPVYVGLKGTSVYHVGPIDEKTIYESFAQEGFVPPIKHITVNLAVINKTSSRVGSLFVPVPVDYRGGLLAFSVSSCRWVDVELWRGLVPVETITNPSSEFMFVKKWSVKPINSSIIENNLFDWIIDRAGYFTFRIVDREEAFASDFQVTLDLRFLNYWELKAF